MQEYSKGIGYQDVNRQVINGLKPPPTLYFKVMAFLLLVLGFGIFAWIYQVKTGMQAAGINHPVGWGVYITNFVFWVGIAHSGTLISAILYLVRSKWRDAVSRSTEAMTVFAVMTAGLFPLIHLGRLWVFYYILPYPNQRDLYPNFSSPLVLDLIAILTYFTVSAIFFYVGMIPDAAAIRDRLKRKMGLNHWRTRFFNAIALGWSGMLSQWRHYNRSYLYFAMLATPLVISVHSVVSWDFAVSNLPGWHSTLFPPYFVAGAIHSGLAMALTLLIPLRKLLKLKTLITPWHLQAIAKFTVFTGLIVAYAYIIEPFIEYYSGDVFHVQFAYWRYTGWMAWAYYLMVACNVLVPLSFTFKKPRKSIRWLFGASLLINAGMWMERYFIVITSTAHDFMPHNWGRYAPSWVELAITAGTAAFFLFMFFGFAKYLPTIPIAEFKDFLFKTKEGSAEEKIENTHTKKPYIAEKTGRYSHLLFIFSSPSNLTKAVTSLKKKGYKNIETFSPFKVPEVEEALAIKRSPVTYWTVAGGIAGLVSGFALTAGSVSIYDLMVGGKPVFSIIPFIIVMFELTVLFAAISNLIAVVYYAGLRKTKTHPWYDERFGIDKFGLLLSYPGEDIREITSIVEPYNPEEVKYEE